MRRRRFANVATAGHDGSARRRRRRQYVGVTPAPPPPPTVCRRHAGAIK